MPFKKGHKKVGGNKKGSQHKHTKELKEMIRNALDKVGGEAYLMKQAKDNPTAFMTLIGKTLPLDVNAKADMAIKVEIVRFGANHTPAGQ